MCFGFISDCSSQQCSISQIYISPAEWLRKHLMNKEFCSSAQELPSGTPGTWMVCLECQRNAEQAPPRAEWYQIPRHYFGTSGAAKWRGNLRLATSKPVTGHTSKILKRRGISCVLQEALRIPNPAALQQPASQGMFLATRRHHIWGAWWSSPVGQAAAWSPKSLGFAASPKLLLCDQYLKATFSPLSLLRQQNQGTGCLLRSHLGLSAFHYPAESCNNAPLQHILLDSTL